MPKCQNNLFVYFDDLVRRLAGPKISLQNWITKWASLTVFDNNVGTAIINVFLYAMQRSLILQSQGSVKSVFLYKCIFVCLWFH